MQNSSWGVGGRPLRVAASFNKCLQRIVNGYAVAAR